MDIKQIMEILPYRYPFLMLDRVEELIPGERARAYKCVTINEPYFAGHIPSYPMMPGVLVMEALGQLSHLVISTCDRYKGKQTLLVEFNKVKFSGVVYPGDRLELEVRVLTEMDGLIMFAVKASVEEKTMVEGRATQMISDI